MSVRMENNILAGQKEASPYRQKISTSFHKDRDLSPGRPKGFCRARGDTKIRAFSFNTLPRSGDSTVSRITIHYYTWRAETGHGHSKIKFHRAKDAPQERGLSFDKESLVNRFFFFFFKGINPLEGLISPSTPRELSLLPAKFYPSFCSRLKKIRIGIFFV